MLLHKNIDEIETGENIFLKFSAQTIYIRAYPIQPLQCLHNQPYYLEEMIGAELLDLIKEVKIKDFILPMQEMENEFNEFVYERRMKKYNYGHFNINLSNKWMEISNNIFNQLVIIFNGQADNEMLNAFRTALHTPIQLAPRSIRNRRERQAIEHEMRQIHLQLIDFFQNMNIQAESFLPVPH